MSFPQGKRGPKVMHRNIHSKYQFRSENAIKCFNLRTGLNTDQNKHVFATQKPVPNTKSASNANRIMASNPPPRFFRAVAQQQVNSKVKSEQHAHMIQSKTISKQKKRTKAERHPKTFTTTAHVKFAAAFRKKDAMALSTEQGNSSVINRTGVDLIIAISYCEKGIITLEG